MEMSDLNSDSLYRDLAERFVSFSRLFDRLGSQEAVKELLDSLILGDAAAFSRLIDPVDIPGITPLGKCFWVGDVISKVIAKPTEVEVCVLREDLTLQERILYLRIALRHLQAMLLTQKEWELRVPGEGPEIPPGPFLDELKANSLVTCTSKVKYDFTEVLIEGIPRRVCI